MIIPFPRLSPTIVTIGPLSIRWYGVMYLAGYLLGAHLASNRIREGRTVMTLVQLDRLVGYLVIGMLVGARAMYALVYVPDHYRADPAELLRIWHGGLSFHGALLGMFVSCVVFARRQHLPIAEVTDLAALAGTPGLAFGRIGNFINGELYGRVTNVPWAMIFPADATRSPRHPSQLYEAVCEGIFLALLLWQLDRVVRTHGGPRPGLVSAAFLVGYGMLRFAIEFTRQPDSQLGLIWGTLSAGQLLCAAMIVIGVSWLAIIHREVLFGARRPRAANGMRP